MRLLVLGLPVATVGLLVATHGCEGEMCVKDTDCVMPYVCVQSRCVLAGTTSDIAGTDVLEVPSGADGEENRDEGALEVPEDGQVHGEDAENGMVGGCRPVTSPAINLTTAPPNVATVVADANERPVALSSGDGFVFFGRALLERTGAGGRPVHDLHFRRVSLDGRALDQPAMPVRSLELSEFHPIVELRDEQGGHVGFATVFKVASGQSAGLWIRIMLQTGSGGYNPQRIPGTDARSGEPTITFDGTDIVVAWTHTEDQTVAVRVQGFYRTDGSHRTSAVTVATRPSGTKEPRIAWGSERHALVYFDGGDAGLHVVMLDRTFTKTREFVILPPLGQTLVGYPALVWNGTKFGLAWQTRAMGSSKLHLATFGPDEAPQEHDILSNIPLSGTEVGQVSLAWGNLTREWGIAWRRTQPSRQSITLARIDGTTFQQMGGLVDLRPGSTDAYHPSVAYNRGFYMVSWIERRVGGPTGEDYPFYLATHGCTPPGP